MSARLMGVVGTLAAFLAGTVSAAAQTADSAQAAFDRGLKTFREAGELKAQSAIPQDEVARRYREAGKAFVDAWKAGVATTEVFTNAGNAFAFAGAIGEAVLFYKRALSVDPGNVRAQSALDHFREKLPIKKPAAGATSSIRSSLFFWHDGLSFRLRRTLCVILFGAGCLFLTVSLFRRKPFAFIGWLFLAPSLVLLGSVLVTAATDQSRAEAVILVDAEGRKGNSAELYGTSHSRPFPPGTEVAFLGAPRPGAESGGAKNNWVNVRLRDGTESWVLERTVEKVLP